MIIVPRAPAARAGRSRSGGQFALLGERRFGPYFWTQFLGAANDNLLKFALTVMVTYQVQLSWLPPASAGLVIGALYILPFVLLSATSGQLADKYDKRSLMVMVKRMEIFIAAWAGWGFLEGSVPVLLACTFLMGVHSTLFGPAKFAYLPQHLDERELTGGNALVAMGTFVAILLGNVAGGLLVAVPVQGTKYAALACLATAVLGRIACHFVTPTPAPQPRSRMRWNVVADTWRTLRCARHQPVVFPSMLGISWRK